MNVEQQNEIFALVKEIFRYNGKEILSFNEVCELFWPRSYP